MVNYTPWVPVEGLDGYFWFEDLVDNAEAEYELIFRLSSEKTKRVLEVSFKVPLSYQKTSSFDFVDDPDVVYRGAFVIMENSSYLKWFLDVSSENWKDSKVQHYSFRTNNYIIDVLSAHEVMVRWLEK